MTVTHKIWSQLTFRCICAVVVGALVVTLFSALLSLYGGNQETVTKVTTRQTLKFPENEKMLDDVAAQLAREGQALSNIAPAAGNAPPPAPKN